MRNLLPNSKGVGGHFGVAAKPKRGSRLRGPTKRCGSRVLAVLLALVMALGMLPFSALATDEITVFVSVENTTYLGGAWDGVLLNNCPVTVPAGTSMMGATVKAFEENNITERGSTDNYIGEINGLSEGDGGGFSGWMGMLNDWLIATGASYAFLEDGDEIRWMFSQDMGVDIGGTWDNNDTYLTALTFSAGTLEPAFDSEIYEYTLTLPEGAQSVKVTPTAANKNFMAKSIVGGTEYARTKDVPVADGAIITVRCGDPDWPSMNFPPFEETDYVVTVIIGGETGEPVVGGPLLTGLTITNINGDIGFEPEKLNYYLRTSAATTASVVFIPVFSDEYTLSVAGDEYQSSEEITVSTDVGMNVVTLQLAYKADAASFTDYTFDILRPRAITLSSAFTVLPDTETTVANIVLEGRAECTRLQANAEGVPGTSTAWSATVYNYYANLLTETEGVNLTMGNVSTPGYIRILADGEEVFAPQSYESGMQFLSTPVASEGISKITIQLCTAATYDDNGDVFIAESEYALFVNNFNLPADELEKMMIADMNISSGIFMSEFSSDSYVYSPILILGEYGDSITYSFTVNDSDTKVFRHLTSSTVANTLTPDAEGVYTHTSTISQAFVPQQLLGYQDVFATERVINGVTVRVQYKFMYMDESTMAEFKVVDYIVPASQYTNTPLFGMRPERLETGSLISLGNFGGYIAAYFEEAIKNDPANRYGVDMFINGNTVDGGTGFSEPGNVWVSADGFDWYLLAGSDYFDDNTLRDYVVTYSRLPNGGSTYTDNYGSLLPMNPDPVGAASPMYKYPLKANYPLYKWEPGEETSMTFTGPLLLGSGTDPFGSSSAGYPFWGYVDVASSQNNPYTTRGQAFDISWAIDEDGMPVYLDEIHYIKVSTASHIYAGGIGEKSTEVASIERAVPAEDEVGVTAAPSAITINGSALSLADGVYIYSATAGDGELTITVDAGGANVFINNQSGAARTYDAAPTSGIIRIVAQEGDKEPIIYYVTLAEDDGEPGEPGEPWDGTADTSWYNMTGTSFMLSTAEQLAGLAAIVNGTADGMSADNFAGKTVALAAGISLNDPAEELGSGSNLWTRIGATSVNSFAGTFDGAGHTISGLYIATGTSQGLFGYIGAGGVVKDLTISDSSVTGTTDLGFIAGSNAGTVSGITVVNSTITGTQRVGGIVGDNTTSGIITVSANKGAEVRQSSNSDDGIGGIVGRNAGSVALSYNNADIIRTNGSTSYDGYFGGIAGQNNNAAASIDSCYNTGIVPPGYRAGGIVGLNTSGSISNSYNIGSVTKSTGSGATAGGVSGNSGSPLNCYYIDSCISITDDNGLGTRIDESGLKALASELGGAFDSDLIPNINNGYPILKWQNPDTTYAIRLTVTPIDAIVVLADSDGEMMPDSSNGGVYIFSDLAAGNYSYSISQDDGDYAAQTGVINLSHSDDNRIIALARNLYEVSFSVTPGDAIVSITTAGFEQSMTAVGGVASFSLPMGTYEYSVERFGYLARTGSLTVAKGIGVGIETVVLDQGATRDLTFNVTPNDAAIIVTHPTQGVQTPTSGSTYSLYESETYSYTIRLSGYVTVRDTVAIGSSDITINVVLAEGISSWDGVTATEPPLADGVYQIADGEHLAWFRDKVNSELVIGSGSNAATVANNSTSSKLDAVLLNDIDLDGNEWQPIGTYVNNQASYYGVPYGYAGTFDGNGKTISGLSITTGADGSGLFGVVFGSGVVKNLAVEGNITVGQYSGGIAGIAQGGGNSSTITPAPATGATITNCTSYVNITVNRNLSGSSNNIMVGGIAGGLNNHASANTHGVIEYCMNYGTIIGGPNSYIGGIAGNASNGIAVRYCGNEGDISGQNEIGGIVGDHANVLVSDCYNAGSVSGTGTYIGGIAGYSNRVTQDCYNTGSVSGQGQIGGIVGRLVGTNGRVSGSYSTGAVSKTGSGAADTCGAVVGSKGETSQTVFSSFYLEGTADAAIGSNANELDDAVESTAEELQKLSTVAHLGSSFVYAANSYPLLRWQTGGTDYAILFDANQADAAVTLKDSSNITVAPQEGAYGYMLPVGSYTYEISKTDYITVSGTITIPADNTVISILLFPATPDDEDIAEANTVVEAALSTAVFDQQDISDAASAKAAVEAIIAGLDLAGVTATVTEIAFTAAVTGTGSNPGGTNGEYIFTVSLVKGDGVEQTYNGLLTIAAAPYESPEPIIVSIFYGNANESGFPVILLDYELDPGLSEAYGFVDAYDGAQATMLDAVVAAHIAIYGEGFASMDVLRASFGNVTRLFGDTSGNYMFFVNNWIPGVGDDMYTVPQMALNDGDDARLFIGADDWFGWDSFIWFEADGNSVKGLTVEIGEAVELTLMGYDNYAWGMMMGYPNNIAVPFGDAYIVDMLVEDEGGYLSAVFSGTVVLEMTGGNGAATVTFDEEGVYYLSAMAEDIDYDDPILPAWLVITVTGGAIAPPPAAYETAMNGALTYVLLQASDPNMASVGGEWAVLARARAGKDDAAWVEIYLANLRAAIAGAYSAAGNKVMLDNNKPTENERVILALTALGNDASDFEGYDFVSPLADMAWVQRQGVNSNIYALIALNSKPYNLIDTEPLLSALLDAQHADSGWGLTALSTVDITAMAIQALAPYYGQRPAVTAAVDNALIWLGGRTISDAEGNVQAIVALAALGMDAGSYVDALLTFYDEASGGFKRAGFVDMMATEQAAYALVAYHRYLNGGNALYDMSDAGAPATPGASDEDAVNNAAAALTWSIIAGANAASNDVRTNLNLPTIGDDGVAIAWSSDNAAHISDTGVVTRPGYAEGNMAVTLTATITKGAESRDVTFALIVTAQNPPSGTATYARISVTDPGATGSQTRVYFAENQFALNDGETAFSLLQRTGLTIRTASYSQYAGVYVEAINGFGEFDDGPLSGWMYKVNGVFPDYSASLYELSDGDIVEWVYTRNLGQDIGGGSGTGGGANTGPGGATADDGEDWTTQDGGPETPLVPIVWTNQFIDIAEDSWYFEAVKYAFENGLMRGVSDTGFAPGANLTRAQLVTILARSAGVNTDGGSTWYEAAVAWGMEKGITDGTNPGGEVTREQFVTMLFRYANEILGIDTSMRADLSRFVDMDDVSDWAKEAMSWAVSEGLVKGRTDVTLAPDGTATRAEAAMLMMRFMEYI